MWTNIAQFSLIHFNKLYVYKEKPPPANQFFLFAFLILPGIAMHLGVYLKWKWNQNKLIYSQ